MSTLLYTKRRHVAALHILRHVWLLPITNVAIHLEAALGPDAWRTLAPIADDWPEVVNGLVRYVYELKIPLIVEEALLAMGISIPVLTATFFMEVANVYAEELKPRMQAAQPANGGRTGFVITPDGKHTIATFRDNV